MENTDAYQKAKKRVEAKIGFYSHFAVYVVVILFLAFINVATSTETIWFHWPMMGWGVAVVIHGLAVFLFPNRTVVTEKMIEKEMNKQH